VKPNPSFKVRSRRCSQTTNRTSRNSADVAGEVRRRYQAHYNALWETVGERYAKLQGRFERHMGQLEEQRQTIEDEIRQELEDLQVELPEIPEADSGEDLSKDWLFDSEREFLDQTNRLRRYAGKKIYGE
jgi:hypothetical protein